MQQNRVYPRFQVSRFQANFLGRLVARTDGFAARNQVEGVRGGNQLTGSGFHFHVVYKPSCRVGGTIGRAVFEDELNLTTRISLAGSTWPGADNTRNVKRFPNPPGGGGSYTCPRSGQTTPVRRIIRVGIRKFVEIARGGESTGGPSVVGTGQSSPGSTVVVRNAHIGLLTEVDFTNLVKLEADKDVSRRCEGICFENDRVKRDNFGVVTVWG